MFAIGDTVYLKAADRVYDACLNKYIARPRTGPLTVENIYRCGAGYNSHTRLKAIIDGGNYGYHDAAISAFEPA